MANRKNINKPVLYVSIFTPRGVFWLPAEILCLSGAGTTP
jgi:hypothetical protein